MKKLTVFVVILAAFLSGSLNSSLSAQTRQEKKQISAIEKEISLKQVEANRFKNQMEDLGFYASAEARVVRVIAGLKADTSAPKDIKTFALAQKELKEKNLLLVKIQEEKAKATAKNKGLTEAANLVYARIDELENSRQVILDRYTTTTNIPREMTHNTMKRRLQANVIRREESSLDVLEHLPVFGDIVDTTLRLKAILANTMINDVTFLVKQLDGGLPQPIVIAPGETSEIFLVPGNYVVIVKNNSTGRIVGTGSMPIDRVVKYYKGLECHGFASTPRY